MSTATTTMASVPMPMPVPDTESPDECSPTFVDDTTDGDGQRSSGDAKSNINNKDGGKDLEETSPPSTLSSATKDLQTTNNVTIAESIKNDIRPRSHATALGKDGIPALWSPSNAAQIPRSMSSSPSSPSSPSPLASSVAGMETHTSHELRKGRPKRRHRHQKTRSRSENDIDSQSTIESRHLDGSTRCNEKLRGAWTMKDVKAYFGIIDGRDSNKTLASDLAEQSPTSNVPVNQTHSNNDTTAASSPSKDRRTSVNSTGPMIVDSNMARLLRHASHNIDMNPLSSQQCNQTSYPVLNSHTGQPSAPSVNASFNALYQQPHHHYRRQSRDSTSGASSIMVHMPHVRRFIPTAPISATPPSRKLSTTAVLGSVDITVFLPGMKQPIIFYDRPQTQYTKLPDHRPPLRRDKPVRIMLPASNQGLRDEEFDDASTTSYWGDRLIFPAVDRSFIFIPREMRPNQKTNSNFLARGSGSGRGRGRGGGYHHVPAKSLDSSAFHLEMFHPSQHNRRHNQPFASTNRSHHHSFSSSYLGHITAGNRRQTSFPLNPQSPSVASARLPPRPVPGVMPSFPTHQTQHPSLRYLPGTSEQQANLERQLGIPTAAMVPPMLHTNALSRILVSGAYPPFPAFEPPTVAAPPPYPPPSHRPIPEFSVPVHGSPSGSVPIHQPQPQKRISLPSIINHTQGDTPPPLRRHLQATPQGSDTMQDQRYQIPSPAFSSGALPHQPLQPLDYSTYPGAPENKAGNPDAFSLPSQANAYAAQPGSRLPGDFDGNPGTGNYYGPAYQGSMAGFAMPHTVAHERNGTVYYDYEYGCEEPKFQFPYQPETLPPSSFPTEPPGLSFQTPMAGVSATGQVPPANPPFQSTPYNMAPATTTSAGTFQVPYQGAQARFGQMPYPPVLPPTLSFASQTTLPFTFGMNPNNMTAHQLASFQAMQSQHQPPASQAPPRMIPVSGTQVINP